jgi:prevent-host-death family protein
MKIVGIHEAKKHLSKLIEDARNGVPFIIAKAGKPLVKVVAVSAPPKAKARRLGFLRGQILVPADFDSMGSPEIEPMFKTGK